MNDKYMKEAAALATEIAKVINKAGADPNLGLLALAMMMAATITQMATDNQDDKDEALEETVELLRVVTERTFGVRVPEAH
jgi:uncharacterized protein YejL (UPF0352 family)